MRASLLLLICAMLLVAACMGEQSTPTPIPTTVPTTAPTAAAQAQQTVRPTSAPSASAPSATATRAATADMPTPGAPTSLTALELLTVRRGPGIGYPVVGKMAEGSAAAILGRAADASWYRIKCPRGLTAPECWVIGDSRYVRLESGAVAVAVVPTPLLPTPTPLLTTTPCQVSSPSGWVRYSAKPGDSIWSVAVRHGITMAQLKAVNCLATMLPTGDVVYVPAPTPVKVVQPPPIGGSVIGTGVESVGASGPVVGNDSDTNPRIRRATPMVAPAPSLPEAMPEPSSPEAVPAPPIPEAIVTSMPPGGIPQSMSHVHPGPP